MEQLTLFDMPKEKSTDWKWTMANDYPKNKNGLKVFSCFACGGGSTMGYKLAGCEVIGCCEIDKRMNELYILNHHPKYNYLMDIRYFNKLDNIPGDLYNLDILDGSPPCTTFSIAGEREDSWGKEKKFREGQSKQTLDDLSFVFIETVKKLQPKVVIMENVDGLLFGEAFKYVRKIYDDFIKIGYKVKHWILRGEEMGVPQRRHRVFFIATRLDFDLNQVDLTFDYEPITYGMIKDNKGKKASQKVVELLNEAHDDENYLVGAFERIYKKHGWYDHAICRNNRVVTTIPAGHSSLWDYENKSQLSCMDLIHSQTFPEDYQFKKDTFCNINYVCGMSVPPVMMKRVVTRLIESHIFDK